MYKHIGIYAYRLDTLREYLALPQSELEKTEKLEQLRALENGIPIDVVAVDTRGKTVCSIDRPEDVKRVEEIIRKEGELF